MRIRRYNMLEGTFPYGARIELGEIFKDESRSELQRGYDAWKALYGWSAKLMPIRLRAKRLTEMIEGLTEWIKKEQQMLNYTPTADEVAAGYEAYCKKIGVTGTIYALAKSFGVDPDVILRWPYAKVFGILYHDLEELKFSRAYDKVLVNKSKYK